MADKISITICGDGGCGKSSITLRLVRSQWTHEYDPTIEDSYSVTRTIDGLPYHLSLTDTAGQEEYRSLWAASNLCSDAFLLVYDITNPNSLDALQYFTDMIDIEAENREESNRRILSSKEYKANPRLRAELRPPPIKIVAGNKCDLKESRQITSREGLEWARSRNCGFMETSAREMVNVEETFALIVRRVVEARRVQQQQITSGAFQQNLAYSLTPRMISLRQPNMTLPVASRMGGSPPLRINAQQPLSPAPQMSEKGQDAADAGNVRRVDESRWDTKVPWWKRWFGACFGR